ncbi:uncharacterized protein EI90DRAFT_3051283, partial [Cantharellus anzutake]|uniref:uncharacterized protein n=1 Tax=Cantharellus anzutake TaxID=1750568 RepID=UPI0019041C94
IHGSYKLIPFPSSNSLKVTMRFWSAFVLLTALLPIVTARFHYGLISQGYNQGLLGGGIVPSLIGKPKFEKELTLA